MSLSHSFVRFVQTADSFRKVNDSLYEWAFESLVHMIHSKRGLIQKLDTARVLLYDINMRQKVIQGHFLCTSILNFRV